MTEGADRKKVKRGGFSFTLGLPVIQMESKLVETWAGRPCSGTLDPGADAQSIIH